MFCDFISDVVLYPIIKFNPIDILKYHTHTQFTVIKLVYISDSCEWK